MASIWNLWTSLTSLFLRHRSRLIPITREVRAKRASKNKGLRARTWPNPRPPAMAGIKPTNSGLQSLWAFKTINRRWARAYRKIRTLTRLSWHARILHHYLYLSTTARTRGSIERREQLIWRYRGCKTRWRMTAWSFRGSKTHSSGPWSLEKGRKQP
jgi:hypothetical protein